MDKWLHNHGDYDCVYPDKQQLHAIVSVPGHIAKSKRDTKKPVSGVDIPVTIKIIQKFIGSYLPMLNNVV